MAAIPLQVPLRRKHPRYELTSPVEVTVLRSGIPQNLPGRLVDAGLGGLSVVLAGDLYIGESVGIEFPLPNSSELVQARARVRRARLAEACAWYRATWCELSPPASPGAQRQYESR